MIEMENIPLETWPGTDNSEVDEYRQASKEFIETLPHVTASEESCCCICMDKIQFQENITILPCTHKYHSPCVDGWLLIKPSCPICKTRIN